MANNTVDKRIKMVMIKGIIQQVFGWFNAVLFGIVALVGFTSIRQAYDVGMSTFCAVLTVGAIILIVLGVKNINLIKTFRNYSARLTTDPAKSINSLAASMGVSVESVTRNITAMLNHGLFPDVYINKQTNCLVYPNSQPPLPQPVPAPAHPVSYATVQCKGCGAMKKIVRGVYAECDFCGSQVSSEA